MQMFNFSGLGNSGEVRGFGEIGDMFLPRCESIARHDIHGFFLFYDCLWSALSRYSRAKPPEAHHPEHG
jgi:hypothetical protein